MHRSIACICLAAAVGMVWAQATDPKAAVPVPPATFLASDAHLSPKADTGASMSQRTTQMEMRNVTLLMLIQRAYAIDSDKIYGGPRLLDVTRYVVIGKTPPGVKTQDTPPMLKALLAERFALKVHEDQRPLPTYVLSLGKGKHKLKASEGGEPRCGTQPSSAPFVQHFKCSGYPMGVVTDLLRSMGSGAITGRIVDQTGLEGNWDIDIEFTPPQMMAQAGPEGVSLFDAIDRQLGLKLEMQRMPQTVLVIDSVNETPTPNEPGIESKLEPPPQPPSIEVATIKLSPPGAPPGGIGMRTDGKGGGQMEMRGMKISGMLQQSWDIPVDRMVGLPVGIDDVSYDVLAKLQLGESLGFAFNSIRPLMQGLMKERFNLKAHLEERPVDAYKLVSVKPKMTAADPANRAGCKDSPLPDVKDPREKFPTRSRLMTCLNMTLDEFTDRLQGISSGYLRAPVTNATKLDGMWDFMLNFSPARPTNNPGAPAPSGTAPSSASADPTADLSFFDAVTSQLGLRLELEKRMMPVLVIEHVDATPTDN